MKTATTIAIIIAALLAQACATPAPADPAYQACDYEARKAAAGVINPFDRGFTIVQLRDQCLRLKRGS